MQKLQQFQFLEIRDFQLKLAGLNTGFPTNKEMRLGYPLYSSSYNKAIVPDLFDMKIDIHMQNFINKTFRVIKGILDIKLQTFNSKW